MTVLANSWSNGPLEMLSSIVLGALAVCLSAVALVLYRKQALKQSALNPVKPSAAPSLLKPAPAAQKPAELPDPDPFPPFDLSTKKTRNYIQVNKCIRYPYFQTMAHQSMHVNDWIEVDKDYAWYIKEKSRVYKEEGKRAIDSLPENDAGAQELLLTVIDYLPKRFPSMFDPLPDGIHNKVTGTTFNDCSELSGIPALEVVSQLTQCDFLMGREREDGKVYFTGGVVAFPGFYLLNEKIGKSMEQVHEPVPDFNQKILKSVERTLKRFKPNEPFERSSWEIVDDWNLFRHNMVDLPEGTKLGDYLEPEDFLFRIDRQTFRKLPKTQAIIFGVHPLLKRLGDFKDDPLIPALLKAVHEKSPEHLMDYKMAPMYQDSMLKFLDRMTKSQIERGLIKGDEDVSKFRDYAQQAV